MAGTFKFYVWLTSWIRKTSRTSKIEKEDRGKNETESSMSKKPAERVPQGDFEDEPAGFKGDMSSNWEKGETSPRLVEESLGGRGRRDGSPKKERRWPMPRGKGADLLHWKDMPKHLQFNPYIFTGYRPMLSVWGCLNSLFYLHNETINILTHAIPIIYILLTVPGMMPWSNSELRFLSWCHVVGILCPWVGSFVYHLFMNLELGERVYYRLLQLDMLGIWISQSFGAMPMVTATTYCLPKLVRWCSVCSYCILSLWGLYKAMTAWSPWERRLCFTLPFIMRMILLCVRYTSIGGGDPAAFVHVVLQDLISVTGAAIGAMHIPEKWFPGTVDVYLNSHNIMHVLVVAAVYSMHVATMKDLAWMTRVKCNAASF